MLSIDLNCDMGEGMTSDTAIMPFITSANIACGYHAGNEATMQKTIALAKQHNVCIGAHPGFNDKVNFGRTEMQLPVKEVYELVFNQVALLQAMCIENNNLLHHVKPHGALYNMAAKNAAMANAIARAVIHIDNRLIVYGLSGSLLISEAEKVGLKTASEVFADRTYQNDGSLTPRNQPNALITEKQQCVDQVLQMINLQVVTSIHSVKVPIKANTICLHGDGAHAAEFARSIHQQLRKNNIEIKSL